VGLGVSRASGPRDAAQSRGWRSAGTGTSRSPIEADPFASVLECEGGVLGVGDQVPRCLGASAEVLEDLPVAIAGADDSLRWAAQEAVGNRKAPSKRRGNAKAPRVLADSDERAQHGSSEMANGAGAVTTVSSSRAATRWCSWPDRCALSRT